MADQKIDRDPTFEELLEQLDPRAQPEGLKLADIPQINTFHILRKFGYGVFKYSYKIEPAPQAANMNASYMYPLFENFFVYDHLKALPILDVVESVLYLPKKIESFVMREIANPFIDKYSDKINLTVKYRNEVPLSDQVDFFNNFFALLNFQLNFSFAQYYYNSNQKIDMLDYWLSSSPGVVTEVSEFKVDETNQHIDLLVRSDMSNRIATQNNILELMKIFRDCKANFIFAVKSHFIGSMVKVTYGGTTKEHMISDIDGTRNPDSMVFERNDLTYVQFFAQEHNIQINDLTQPLLIHCEYVHEQRRHVTMELIPELCRLSKINSGPGLVDVEADKPLPPIIRYQKLMKFFHLINSVGNCNRALSDWGFSIERSVHTVLSDNLPPAWSHLLRGSLLDPVDLNNKWLIIYYNNDRWLVDSFLRRCNEYAERMAIRLDTPRRYRVNNQDTDSYLNAVKANISEEDRIVVIVTPGSVQIQERYDAIKQYCTEVRGIPTQFVRSVTLTQPRKLETIGPNILVQMNCKVGGVPWSVDMPLSDVMYVGLDVYQGFISDDERQHSTLGFAASTNMQGTRWFSKVAEQPLKGICDKKLGWLVKDALYQYKKNNRALPRSIVIYRKEGDASWKDIARFEWTILNDAIQSVYEKEAMANDVKNDKVEINKPYVVLMSVTRRISPGFSAKDRGNWFDNDDSPPITNKQVLEALSKQSSGKSRETEEVEDEAVGDSSSDYITADDDEIAQHLCQSFYLSSQNTELSPVSPVIVRVLRQSGTPTGLKEADPESGPNPQVLSNKFLQNLSVKLCYLYYNIPAVCYQPSPILYAQKLAFFTGSHLNKEANEILENKLYFL